MAPIGCAAAIAAVSAVLSGLTSASGCAGRTGCGDEDAPSAREAATGGECPPERLLWNNICRDATWPPNRGLITRAVATPDYLGDGKPSVIDITIGRQLFVDSFLMSSRSTGVTIEYWSPQYANENPVLKATEPWEMATDAAGGYGGFASSFSGSAFYNPEADRYELFYRCGDVTCVAYSADAVAWTKPAFASAANGTCRGAPCNVVLDRSADGATVWLDAAAKNKSRRYVLATGGSEYTMYTSATGERFVKEAVSGPIEDRSSIYYDALRSTWVYSIKGSDGMKPPIAPQRMRKYHEGADPVADCHWSAAAPAVNWVSADVNDDANVACGGEAQLYNLDGVAYESVVVGLFSIITGKRCSPPRPFGRGGEQDAVYVGFSRNGFDWFRSPLRAEAFLPMSPTPGSWHYQNVQSVGGGFLTHPETLQFFVGARSGTCAGSGNGCTNGQWNGNATTGTAFLRRDGFASVAPRSSAGGAVVTEVMRWSHGSHLFVNIEVGAGGVASVDVLSPAGETLKSSLPIAARTNSTRYHVQWKDGAGLEKFVDTPVRLRFSLLIGSRLFSFWISDNAATGCSGGPVAGGGRGFNGTHDRCA